MSNKYQNIVLFQDIFFLSISLLFAAALNFDCLVKCGYQQAYFTLSDGYMTAIFTAIFTIATLGGALMTIILNSFSQKIVGLPLKEVMNLKTFSLCITKVMPILLVSVLIGYFAFLCELIWTAIIILFFIIFILIFNSYAIWLMFSDDKLLIEVIQMEMETKEFIEDTSRQSYYLQIWMTEVEEAFFIRDKIKQDDIIALILKIQKINNSYSNNVFGTWSTNENE